MAAGLIDIKARLNPKKQTEEKQNYPNEDPHSFDSSNPLHQSESKSSSNTDSPTKGLAKEYNDLD